MGFVELFLIAIGVSMDAFAVSICKGLGMRKIDFKKAGVIALFFGGFQAVMPLIGWALGTQFEHYITGIDHWIAFVLLSLIGSKMLWDATHEEASCETCEYEKFNLKELVLLSVATSIDALAVGITLAFLRVDIVWAVALIGVTTFVLSFVGVIVGNRVGGTFKKGATVVGGVVLIAIGLKILLEHLGLFG